MLFLVNLNRVNIGHAINLKLDAIELSVDVACCLIVPILLGKQWIIVYSYYFYLSRLVLNSQCLLLECVLSSSDKPWQFSSAGIELDDKELASFVEHIDEDNNGVITFKEWRDFLLLYPHEATMENIYHYWERVYLVDIGEHAVILEGISKRANATKYLIAGGVAGAASRTATAPLDLLKVIFQVQTKHVPISHAVQSIWKEGGLLGFFRGNGLNVIKVGPESAIKFYTYEMLKNVIGDSNGDTGILGRLTAGGLAGAVAQTSIYPMDLIKTRLQTYSSDRGSVPNIGKLARDILTQEGPRAFYKGLIPSLLGIVPYAGIDLAAYETLKDMSRKYILKDDGMLPMLCMFYLHYV